MKLFVLILLTLVVVFMWGDFIYARIVAAHYRQWEKTIERDADGVREGCHAFTLGDGETAVLMIHGINDSPKTWYKMAPLLAEQGFTCRAMRLPGFAMPIDDYGRATAADWLAAVEREMAALRERHRRVTIVAHSLGGAVAIAHLLERPDAADRVVLLAPAVEVSSHRSPLLPVETWHKIGSRLLLFTSFTESPYPNDAHDPMEKEYPWRTRFTPRRVIDETFLLLDRIHGRGGELQVPLMMVLSRDDQVVDWQAAQRFYDQVASPVKQLHFTADTGHVIPVDYGWRELTDDVAAFLAAADDGAP